MPKSDGPDQLPLFDDDSAAGTVPSPQPWRTTPADAWSAEKLPSPSALEHTSPDLLRRNLEFLRAMELHAGKVAPVEVRRFRERHEELLRHLVRWRTDGDEEDGRAAVAALADLADLRLRALGKLDPGRVEKVMAAEPRVRVRDLEIERALSMAEFELVEARGELVGLEISAPPGSTPLSGWLGPGEVGSREDGSPHGLRPELFEALSTAFPDGIVKPVRDESNLKAMERYTPDRGLSPRRSGHCAELGRPFDPGGGGGAASPVPPARPVPRRSARSLETSVGSTGRGTSSEGGLSFHDEEFSDRSF